MASVWIEMAKATPTKVKGGLKPRVAIEDAAAYVKEWVKAGAKTRHAKSAPGFTFLLFEQGRLSGSVFVEVMSPPSKPEKGQPLRTGKCA